MPIHLAPLAAVAPEAVETLLDRAFGTDRRGRTAYRLRQGMHAIDTMCFGAFEDGVLVGSIQCWPVELRDGARATPMVLVGPVAVEPELQRGGVGQTLMLAMLDVADRGETSPLVLIGDPEYYGRFFGFLANQTQHWELPGPFERHRLLVRTTETLPEQGRLGPRVPALTRA